MKEFVPPSGDGAPRWHTIETPIGELLLRGDGHALTHLRMDPGSADVPPGAVRDAGAFRDVEEQLRAYFAGELTEFDLALAPSGSAFQLRVWGELCEIPYGETISYEDLAHRVGRAGAARAVGSANGRNRIAIAIPCHRVIEKGGAPVAPSATASPVNRLSLIAATVRTASGRPAAPS